MPEGDDASSRATVIDRPPRDAHERADPLVAEPSTELDSSTSSESSLRTEPSAGGTPRMTVTSPLDAWRQTEVLSTRVFTRGAIMLALLGLAVVWYLPGNRIAGAILVGGIVIGIAGMAYLRMRARDTATYHQGLGAVIGWYAPCLGVVSAVPYFGPFSPVPVVLVLGIYFNVRQGTSRALGFAIYLTCAIGQGLSGALVIAHVIDPGIIHAEYLPLYVKVTAQVLVQAVLLATYLIADASRRSSLLALTALEQATRAVAQREALLEEARAELRRAIGSGRGRFTDQVIGRYQLGDVLGRGAMGEVYDAVETSTGQPVAIKMLSQASLGNAQHVHRFLRELETASRLDSPHVVRVIEIGEQPLPHLVMERLRGRDLGQLLRSTRSFSHARVVDLVRQVGDGITTAGALGIVHRDLKPQNLFLAGRVWKILDFGVARGADTTDTLTHGHVVGTPAYMAPEQARGDAVDHRTDLYALAAIAYRALTGHAPFGGSAVAETLYAVVHTSPRRPSAVATLGGDVDLVLAIGLAKDPAARLATAAAFADALEAALAGQLDPELRVQGRALVAAGAWRAARASTAR